LIEALSANLNGFLQPIGQDLTKPRRNSSTTGSSPPVGQRSAAQQVQAYYPLLRVLGRDSLPEVAAGSGMHPELQLDGLLSAGTAVGEVDNQAKTGSGGWPDYGLAAAAR